jgi:hypothetical protein
VNALAAVESEHEGDGVGEVARFRRSYQKASGVRPTMVVSRRFERSRNRAASNFKVVNHGVGDRSFGDDPDDVACPRPSPSAKDDCRARAVALEPGQDEPQQVRVATERR